MEHQKPSHDELLPSLTIHARNDWSQDHVDDDMEAIKAELLVAAQQTLNWDKDSTPTQIDCHRWRYAATRVDTEVDVLGSLIDETKQWVVSGDWCARGNIESCYQIAQQTGQVMWKTALSS